MGGMIQGPKFLKLFFILAIIAIPCFAVAQPANEAEEKAIAPTGELSEIAPLAPGLRTIVSIDAEDAYLPTVLSILAEKSGYNIVTGPGVSKEERISIHLKDTPIEQAMNLVVRAAGLSYEIVGSSFLIAKADKLKEQVGLNSYVVALQYAEAMEVQKLLSDFQAQIQIDRSGNKLLVITTPKIISAIRKVIQEIDRPALQITLAARLIEVQVEDEERLGINWSKLSTSTKQFIYEGHTIPGAASATAVDALSDRSRQFNLFEEFSDVNSLGDVWRSQPVYEIALDWLLKNSRAEVLTNTSVVTMNARPAMIELVDVVPYVTSSGGVGGQVTVQREEVGIKLAITPQVNTDGYITVSVHPEVSSIFEFIGPDQTIPRIVRRSSAMTVRVKNHQSIIIGGLMGLVTHKTLHKVPFFGDLPFLGGLFRYNVIQSSKTDLIVEVTPHILVDEYTHIDRSKEIKSAVTRYNLDLNPGSAQE